MPPSPFTISVPDAALDELKQKLAHASFPDELVDAEQWAYGVPLADVKRLANYWRDGFDWRKAEASLNELPNFTTTLMVERFGLINIHFVHQQSPVEGAIPLLFVHGWPGSFEEVTKLLPLLKGDNGSPAFHVVAPSLPNFGFSDAVKTKGFSTDQYAETCHKLMLQLGYSEYVTQGGDWGMYITRYMGLHYPQHVKASHINMIRANPPQWYKNPLQALKHTVLPYSAKEKEGLVRSQWFAQEGSGYRFEASTKPQTLGYALADSPVALLAWIYEKLHDWTDNYPWTDDEILTWISIYWFSTAGPAASLRIYYEAIRHEVTKPAKPARNWIPKASDWIPHVPLGLAYFPKELAVVPHTWGRTLGRVVYESDYDRGGHFAAWERPDAIARDLQQMFGANGPCYGVVKGKTGYARLIARL